MARREIQLQGIDQLLSELRRRSEAASKRVESKALKAGGEVMAEDMRERAPYSSLDKIHLRDNIVVTNVRRKDGVKYVLVGPNKRVSWRAHFPEFGTSKMPATPYITPAFIAKRREALEAIAEELGKGLRSK